MLTIQQYDNIEARAKIDLSFNEIIAFSTILFDQQRFPTYARDEKELARYAEWNRDIVNLDLYKPNKFIRQASLKTIYSAEESEIIIWLCDQVEDLTYKLTKRRIRPMFNPLAKLGLFRVVQALLDIYNKKQFSIFEIGPGTGYFASMLINAGHTYASMDNTQGFYLWQNRLFEHIVGNEFIDWASQDPINFGQIKRVTHVPWWTFLKFGNNSPIKTDIVVAEACLGEMHPDALMFTLAVAKHMLKESDVKLFLFSDVGSATVLSEKEIFEYFSKAGFVKIFKNNFYGFIPRGFTLPKRAFQLEGNLPIINSEGIDKRLAASDFMHVPHDCYPLGHDFVKVVQNIETQSLPDILIDEYIAAINSLYRNKKILFYPAGAITEKFINHANQINSIIVGIGDKNKKGELCNFKIFHPNDLATLDLDVVIICSSTFKDEIYQDLLSRLKNTKIDICVYGDPIKKNK